MDPLFLLWLQLENLSCKLNKKQRNLHNYVRSKLSLFMVGFQGMTKLDICREVLRFLLHVLGVFLIS